jgi:hypothetical protein
VLKTACRAMVSSTVPRLDDRWPPVLRDRVDQEGAQFGRQLRQLLALQAAQVGRAVDGFKQGIAHFNSELPVADEVGQLVQAGGALAEDGQGVEGIGAQFVGVGAGGVRGRAG